VNAGNTCGKLPARNREFRKAHIRSTSPRDSVRILTAGRRHRSTDDDRAVIQIRRGVDAGEIFLAR